MKLTNRTFILSFLYLIVGCSSGSWRDPAFDAVSKEVESLGLSLSFDNVDGGFTVYAKEADDESIKKAVRHLNTLWQGKAITEFDYERRFTFLLSGTDISDNAIDEILNLQVTRVRIDGTGVTSASLKQLSNAPYLRILEVGANQFTQMQIDEFINSQPNVVVSIVE